MSLSRSIFVKAGLGQILRELRAELGLTQEAFARSLDVSLNTIKRYDQSRFDPDPIILLRIIKMAPDHWKIRLVPYLPPELVEWGEAISQRQSRAGSAARYNLDTVYGTHASLDAIFEKAPSEVVQKLVDQVARFAAQYADGEEPAKAPKKRR